MKLFRYKQRQNVAQRGYSLLEVLIALAVLSIGLLGISYLQVKGMQFNTDSYLRTQATVIAYDIMDRMRANKVGTDAGSYLVSAAPGTPETCGDGTGCTSPTELANYDLTRWYQLQAATLPATSTPSNITRITITTGSGATIFQYTITMNWLERDLEISQAWVVEI